MNYDFDTVVNRKNTNAIKYDLAKKRGKPEDAVSLWVAAESGAIVVRITDIMALFIPFF